ncbi:hypothetical protein [Sphingomonas arenae]|uniref:hypothetical protein n=1 Tax=Sphingomonas arenae TaxID=2812555 RepID=UPI0019680381|nr:hypothetical protein [Sphingomonas arenae]
MNRSSACSKCGGSMGAGFIVDEGHGTRTVAKWVAGAPERSIWTGLKLRGRERLDVVTYRCSRCGFLESYAAQR